MVISNLSKGGKAINSKLTINRKNIKKIAKDLKKKIFFCWNRFY